MKAHIGVDAQSGLVHTVVTTAANEADVNIADELLHGKEQTVHADAGYTGADKLYPKKGRSWHIAMKRGKLKKMAEGEQKHKLQETEKAKASLLDADSQIADWHDAGLIDNATYNTYTAWSTAQLVDTGNSGNIGGSGQPPIYTPPPQDNPIGAFYESVSPVNDNSLAISIKTPVILDANNANARLTAGQLAARDTNADGRLKGGELAGLNVWADAGEDGIKTSSEISSLTSYLSGQNLGGVASADYGFYTQGNGRWIDSAALSAGATAPSFVQTGAPAMPGRIANGTFTVGIGKCVYKRKRPIAVTECARIAII